MPSISRFDIRLSRIPPALVSAIGQIEELKGRWISGARLSPQVLSRLKKSVLVTSTGASTRIEGAQLSDEEVDQLMRGIAIEKFADRDAQEVRGYFELLQNVFEAWEDLPLSEGGIKHFHRELLKYVAKDELHRGEYKKKENQVRLVDAQGRDKGVLFDTTPAYLTSKEMTELVEWTRATLANKSYHPLLVIGNFVVEFLNIHPFEDGNGRLSRILTNLLLLREGYAFVPYISHEKLIEAEKVSYYQALRASQKTFKTKQESVESWLSFFFAILQKQSSQAISLLSDANIEVWLSPKQLAVWHVLLETGEASPQMIVQSSGVGRPTVNQALHKLVKMKRIERIGEGRATRYRLTQS